MAIQKVFAFVKRDASSAQPTTQPLIANAGINIKYVFCVGNYPANYKDCMVYKDLQKSFFCTLWRKMVVPESQS